MSSGQARKQTITCYVTAERTDMIGMTVMWYISIIAILWSSEWLRDTEMAHRQKTNTLFDKERQVNDALTFPWSA